MNGLKGFWSGMIVVFIILRLSSTTGFAQEGTVQEIKKQIQVLTEELEKLKLGAVAEPKYERFMGLGPAASKVYRIEKGLSLAGYGEFLYENYDKKRDDGKEATQRDQFDALRAVIYLGYKFSDRIIFNSEIEFEHGRTGDPKGVPQERTGSVAVEFAYLDFLLSKPVNVRTGMVLVPMGFLTELHEPPTFHGAMKPDVERIILPSIWRDNGVGILGDPLGDLEYKLYLVSSLYAKGFSSDRGIAGGRQQGTYSISEDLALTGRIDYKGIPGTVIGASFFSGNTGQSSKVSVTQKDYDYEVTDTSGNKRTITVNKTAENSLPDSRVNLWDIHAEVNIRGLEIRGLYAQGTIGDVAQLNQARGLTGNKSIGEKFYGWYLDAGYDILPLLVKGTRQALTPYIIYERYNTQQKVPAGYTADPANNRTTTTFGIGYKPDPLIVIKADYQDRKNKAGTAVDQFNIAIAYMF